jgi:hypothetical protein
LKLTGADLKARKAKNMYKGNYCEVSLYVFNRKNCIRRSCYNLTTSKIFDNSIMLLIFLSSVKLASDTFFINEPKESTVRKINS